MQRAECAVLMHSMSCPWDIDHWKQSKEAEPLSREKNKCLPFQQKELCLTLGDNVLRHLWGFMLLIYKYLNKLVGSCLFTACFALNPSELLRIFGRSK